MKMASTMYDHPRYIQQDFHVSLPSCMYKMTNFQAASTNKAEEKQYPQEVARLLSRQHNILTDLEMLKKQIESLENKAGIKNEGLVEKAIAGNTSKVSLQALDEDIDIILTATPSNPPISAFLFLEYLKQNGVEVSSASHKHSSLNEDLPDKLKDSLKTKDLLIQPHQKLNFSFIWKEDPFGPSLIISPRVQTAIKGNANIARYLCRRFAPHLYESLDENVVSLTDYIMEISHSKIQNGSKDEAKKALKSMEKQVGGNIWLVNNNMTIADIVMWSAVVASKKVDLIPSNLQQWFNNLKKTFIGVSNTWL